MKKQLLLINIFVLTITTHAADWTPIFKPWEQGEASPIISKIGFSNGKSLVIQPSASGKATLTELARTGNYIGIPQPYRTDMLPATIKYGKGEKVGLSTAYIPLKNATLYGLPIANILVYTSCNDCGGVGEIVEFYPMSDNQYKKLKQLKFKSIDDGCGERQAQIYKEGKKVYYELYTSC